MEFEQLRKKSGLARRMFWRAEHACLSTWPHNPNGISPLPVRALCTRALISPGVTARSHDRLNHHPSPHALPCAPGDVLHAHCRAAGAFDSAFGNECTLVTRRCIDAGRGERTHIPTMEQQLQHPPTAAAHLAHRGCPGPSTSTTTHAHGVFGSLLTCLVLCHVRCMSPVMSAVCPV